MKLQNPQLKGGHYAPILGITPDMIVTPPAVLRVVLWGHPCSEIHQVGDKEKIFSVGVLYSNQLYATANNLEEWAQRIDGAKNIWRLVGEK